MRRSRTLPLIVPAALALCIPLPSAAVAADPTPQQQLQATAESFSKVRSYRVQVTMKDEDGTSRLKADVTTSGRVDVSVTIGNTGTFRLRKISSNTYLRGDARYWRSAGGKEGATLAKELAGRWIKTDRAEAKEFAPIFDEVLPKKLARCIAHDASLGTITPGESTTIGGKKANVLVDAGDKPGTAPGKIFIAADGDPLPLRVQQTGPVKPGGKKTACSDPEGTSTTSSDARFSRYNQKLSIKAPKNALTIPNGNGGSGSNAPAA